MQYIKLEDIKRGDIINVITMRSQYVTCIASDKYNPMLDSIPIYVFIGFSGLFHSGLDMEITHVKSRKVKISKVTPLQYIEMARMLKNKGFKFNKKKLYLQNLRWNQIIY